MHASARAERGRSARRAGSSGRRTRTRSRAARCAFPTELNDDVGRRLGSVGAEFGATTGRPRRCGWFDAVLVRRAAFTNSLSGLCVTKLDVLDGLPEIKLCVGYRLDGRAIDSLPLL